MGTFSFVLHESQCSNNCVFCGSREFGDLQKNISREKSKIERLLRDGNEISAIEISGNDPIEYPELVYVAQWLRATLPKSRIRVATHGRGLRPLLPRLLHAGVSHFVIPVYGHEARIHDAVTRTPGSFEDTMDALGALMQARAKFSLTTLITQQNSAMLSELFLFLASFSDTFSVSVPMFSPGRRPSYAVSLEALQNRLERALSAIHAQSTARVKLRNIPRCAVADDHGAEFQISRPPRFGYEHRRYVPGAIRLLETADGILPDYQLLVKGDTCALCIHDQRCPGFYKSYVESGLFRFRPVRE